MKFFKKTITSLLAISMLLVSGVTAFATDSNQLDSDNQDYYCIEEIHYGDEALSFISDEDLRNHLASYRTNDTELYAVAKQTVFVTETLDKTTGRITDSRLMSEAEALAYQTTGDIMLLNDWVGDDTEEHQGGKLSLYLVVYVDRYGDYSAYGTADWENGVYSTGENAPAVGMDFMGITWGGDGELEIVNNSDDVSGIYQYDKGNMSFSRADSDSYGGYCWQFEETIRSWGKLYYADYIDCEVELEKTYTADKGKETNIKLNYIHTYEDTVGTLSFTAGTSGAAGGITLSSVGDQWKIAVDVPGIQY